AGSAQRSATATGATGTAGPALSARSPPAQVALEVGRDGLAAGLGQDTLGLGALLQRPHVLAYLVVGVGHLADGPFPGLGLLGQPPERYLDVEHLLDPVQQRHGGF